VTFKKQNEVQFSPNINSFLETQLVGRQ